MGNVVERKLTNGVSIILQPQDSPLSRYGPPVGDGAHPEVACLVGLISTINPNQIELKLLLISIQSGVFQCCRKSEDEIG